MTLPFSVDTEGGHTLHRVAQKECNSVDKLVISMASVTRSHWSVDYWVENYFSSKLTPGLSILGKAF